MASVALEKLSALTTEQLLELNKAVVGMIRQRQTQQQVQAGRRFNVGDQAMFRDKMGRMVTIEVNRINTKSVSGCEVVGGVVNRHRTWRVAPTFLIPVGV